MSQKDARPRTVCNASGCRDFENQGDEVGSFRSEGETRIRTLLGRPIDFSDDETASSVCDGDLPSHWTPTGCPWRRAACRGARLL